MSDAEENFAYWTKCYADDLAKGRDPTEFGMSWMRHQIAEWRDAAEAERVAIPDHVGSVKDPAGAKGYWTDGGKTWEGQ